LVVLIEEGRSFDLSNCFLAYVWLNEFVVV
jgi:hypothetical protein